MSVFSWRQRSGVPPALLLLLRSPAADLSPRVRRWLIVGAMLYAVLGAVVMHLWQHRGGRSVTQLGFGYGV
ncbi:MAG TPA: hypothetical protein VK477_14870, partial [Acidobacteriota bacterium]|nr:hypothetical protein [Acidobacteriota bacterium]